jgi:PPK2 family polyphosphate:nucleotide phosphotransferase
MNVDRFRVRPGDRAALARHRPDYTADFRGKDAAEERLKKGVERLEGRQDLLHAQSEYALLIVLQGMDAAGKDGVIKHVMSGVNPLGVDVHAFKQPSSEELGHDFLWRAEKVLPARGRIGIFNRSYYEDVLVVRVHPGILGMSRLPQTRVTGDIWRNRFEDIKAFERHLWRNGTIVRKFFLHISRSEQKRRLLQRLDDPAKNWKFSVDDIPERAKWHAYMKAYRDALAATSTDHSPWYVVPSDHKWFSRVVIADVIVQALDHLDLAFPALSPAKRRELARARRQLMSRTRDRGV